MSCKPERQDLGEDEFLVYRNNSDGKGNSFGYHENYLISRKISFEHIGKVLLPFFVSRPIFCGAGKVGAENGTDPTSYQLSQRADFLECLYDLNTMVHRPIINTRDEPHTQQAQFRRLHVIVGDANMCEVSTFLKVGTTAIIIDMLENQGVCLILNWPIPSKRSNSFSRDLTVKVVRSALHNGQHTTALTDSTGISERRSRILSDQRIIPNYQRSLNSLGISPRTIRPGSRYAEPRNRLGSKARRLIESYMDRKHCSWQDPRVAMMDLQYHDIRPTKGLYYTLERTGKIERLTHDEEIQQAMHTAPRSDPCLLSEGPVFKDSPRRSTA